MTTILGPDELVDGRNWAWARHECDLRGLNLPELHSDDDFRWLAAHARDRNVWIGVEKIGSKGWIDPRTKQLNDYLESVNPTKLDGSIDHGGYYCLILMPNHGTGNPPKLVKQSCYKREQYAFCAVFGPPDPTLPIREWPADDLKYR